VWTRGPKFFLFLFCSRVIALLAFTGRDIMDRQIDRQTIALLLVGWVVALVTTLT
jgi:hypothetical protein